MGAKKLTGISHWNHSRHGSIRAHLDPVQHRLIRTKGMGLGLYHCNGSIGSVLHPSILHLGAILLTSAIFALEISQGADHHRLMLVIRRDVPVHLVSALTPLSLPSANTTQLLEQLLQLISAGRAPTGYCHRQLRPQHVLPHFFHFQSDIRHVSALPSNQQRQLTILV